MLRMKYASSVIATFEVPERERYERAEVNLKNEVVVQGPVG